MSLDNLRSSPYSRAADGNVVQPEEASQRQTVRRRSGSPGGRGRGLQAQRPDSSFCLSLRIRRGGPTRGVRRRVNRARMVGRSS